MSRDFVEMLRALSGAGAEFVIGRDALIRNKKSAGRPKDLADVAWLESEGA